MTSRGELRGLYVIIDPAACGEYDPVEVARAALEGGARLIQLRDKVREGASASAGRMAGVAMSRGDALFIVNDHVDLALAVGADGVHVGQKDLPIATVRSIVPREMIVGASTNNVEEARQAEKDGADYVSVGRLFETGSKPDTRPARRRRCAPLRQRYRSPSAPSAASTSRTSTR